MSTETKKNPRLAWIVFAASLLVTIAFLIFNATWFWVTLPIVLTAFVVAIDYI